MVQPLYTHPLNKNNLKDYEDAKTDDNPQIGDIPQSESMIEFRITNNEARILKTYIDNFQTSALEYMKNLIRMIDHEGNPAIKDILWYQLIVAYDAYISLLVS